MLDRLCEMMNLNTGGLLGGSNFNGGIAAMMEEEQVRRDRTSRGGVVTGGHLPALGEIENAGGDYRSLATWGRVNLVA